MKSKLSPVPTEGYGYGRFSSKPQERGDSYRRQTEWIKSEAAKLKVNLLHIFFDESTSGKAGSNLEKEFGQLLKVLKPGQILLVEDQDRLTRQNAFVASQLLNDIVAKGVEIRFKDGQILNKDNIGNLTTAVPAIIKAALSHEENRKKAERLKATWMDKFDSVMEDNKPFPHYTPCWIDYNWDKRQYDYDDDKIDTIKFIFKLASEKVGLLKICNRLNEEKWPLITTRTKTRHWSRTSVNKIVKNKAVYGALELTDGRIKENHYRPIIDKSDFYTIQDGLASRRKVGGGRPSQFFNLYKGLCKCSDCGANMMLVRKHKNNGKVYNYLVCHSKVIGVCKPYIAQRYDVFDDSFMIEMGEHSDLIKKVFASPLDSKKSEAIEGELNTVKQRLQKYQTDIENGTIELSETVSRSIVNIERKVKSLTTELELQRAKETESQRLPAMVNEFFGKHEFFGVHDDGETITFAEGGKLEINMITNDRVQSVLRTLINHITVNVSKKSFTVVFNDAKQSPMTFDMLV
jgi:DNA invertase Pin-like site-specific DNA recombinase